MTDEYGTDFGAEDEGSEPTQTPFQQLRSAKESADKQLKAANKELAELRKFRDETTAKGRQAEAVETFKQVGLNPAHAGLFLALNKDGDITAESVAQFALDNALGTPANTPEPAQAEAAPAAQERVAPTPGFVPVQTDGADNPNTAPLDYKQYRELLNTDPQAAIRAVAAGRVQGLYKNPEGQEAF